MSEPTSPEPGAPAAVADEGAAWARARAGDDTLVRPPGERRRTVGVRFSPSGRTVLCDPENLAGMPTLHHGAWVVVDDRRGRAMAQLCLPVAERRVGPGAPLPRVVRVATDEDHMQLAADNARGTDALAFARERARSRRLDVKFFRVEFSPRGDRVMFYFASEQRIDFREIVRDLAARYHGRIEMRQVGVRDEAKMVGGIGSCGRELCCTTFLPRFEPVSIRMAKNQNIALNPTKVSGQCGRLKCCLVYEDDMYVEAAKNLPKVGKSVETPDGVGRVQDLDILRGRIRVSFPDKPPQVFGPDDVKRVSTGHAETSSRRPDTRSPDTRSPGTRSPDMPLPDGPTPEVPSLDKEPHKEPDQRPHKDPKRNGNGEGST